MASPRQGPYRFDPKSIVEIRNRLGINQAEMARLLGVPANTLSRWETSKATPDAHSLAAIYSVAQERGLNVAFFRQSSSGNRSRLIVMLDFQNLGVSAADIQDLDNRIMSELDRIAPSTDHEVFKAFARPDQLAAVNELRRLKWRVKTDNGNLDQAIIQQSKSDCGHDPDDTTLVICSKDGGFAPLIREMRDWGVTVYVMGPPNTSRRLAETAGSGYWIQWPIRVRA